MHISNPAFYLTSRHAALTSAVFALAFLSKFINPLLFHRERKRRGNILLKIIGVNNICYSYAILLNFISSDIY